MFLKVLVRPLSTLAVYLVLRDYLGLYFNASPFHLVFLNTHKSTKYRTVNVAQAAFLYTRILAMWGTSSMVLDGAITGILCYYLHKVRHPLINQLVPERPGIKQSERMIDTCIAFTVNTGFTAASMRVINLHYPTRAGTLPSISWYGRDAAALQN